MTILLTGSIAVRGSSPFNRIEFCMKKNLLAVAVLCALTSGAAFAQQAESPWLVRVRAEIGASTDEHFKLARCDIV